MSDIHSDAGSGIPQTKGAGPLGAADWLYLAAAPTFAGMAVFTCIQGGDAATLCLGADASPLASMTAMYLLMSVFHIAPWLRVISGRPSRQ
jgi:hypothetical protein